MDDSAAFDPNTASVNALIQRYPNLGFLVAEDIVAWREENGPLKSTAALIALGVSVELAADLIAHVGRARQPHAERLDVSDAEISSAPEPFPVAPSLPPRRVGDSTDLRPTLKPQSWLSTKPEPSLAPITRPSAETQRAPLPSSSSPASETEAEDTTGAAVSISAEAIDVAQASSQAMRTTSTPVPAPPAPPAEKAIQVAPPALPPSRRSRFQTTVIAMIVMANVGLGAGLMSVRHEEHRAHAPVAAMSVEVKELHSTQTDTSAQLEDTRTRLDKQEVALAKTIEKVTATEQRQRDGERAAKEHAEREAKEIAALNARMGGVERKVDFEVHSVDEALKIIDLAHGGPPPKAPAKPAPAPAAEHPHAPAVEAPPRPESHARVSVR